LPDDRIPFLSDAIKLSLPGFRSDPGTGQLRNRVETESFSKFTGSDRCHRRFASGIISHII